MTVKEALNGFPRQLGSAIGDVGKIAERMQTLPALLDALERVDEGIKSLDQGVESLDREVKLMRVSVERLEGKVDELNQDLGGRFDELSHRLSPLRRMFGRNPSD